MEDGGFSPPTGVWAPPPPVAPPLAPVTERVTGRRVAAGLIDLIPLALISIGLGRRVETEPGFQFRLEGMGLVLMAVISLGYYFVLETLTGTTAGKRLMGITVVDADGGRPGAGTVLKRTLLRIVDALPALYLVGFICVLATPDKRRVGDMVAHTRVVSLRTAAAEAERTGRPRSGTRAALALLVGAAALAGGVIGTVARITETSSADRLGHFEVDQDMEPRIREVMAAFENPTTSGIEALFAEGATDTQAIDELLTTMDNALGAFTGSYTIIDHHKSLDADVSPLGHHDLMQFELTAEFEQSTPTVIITFAVLEGQLEMLGWNVGTG
jgi:uncharacterized RDD family membrane protein YckC